MKKLRFIGNFIFFSLVVYFVGQSVNVFLGRKAMQASLISTDKEIQVQKINYWNSKKTQMKMKKMKNL